VKGREPIWGSFRAAARRTAHDPQQGLVGRRWRGAGKAAAARAILRRTAPPWDGHAGRLSKDVGSAIRESCSGPAPEANYVPPNSPATGR
jgi:hypothetical protein